MVGIEKRAAYRGPMDTELSIQFRCLYSNSPIYVGIRERRRKNPNPMRDRHPNPKRKGLLI